MIQKPAVSRARRTSQNQTNRIDAISTIAASEEQHVEPRMGQAILHPAIARDPSVTRNPATMELHATCNRECRAKQGAHEPIADITQANPQ